MNHIESLKDVLNSISLGTAALVENKVDNKYITFIVIKDCFDNIIYSTEKLKYEIKAATFTINSVICCLSMIKMSNSFTEEYYKFNFNFYDENSLRLLMDLRHQKRVYLILSNEIGDCKEIIFNNELRDFFKGYMKKSSGVMRKWSIEQYNKALLKLNVQYNSMVQLWDNMGDKIELGELENYK